MVDDIPMTTEKLNALKREWNAIMAEGRPMRDRLFSLAERAHEIQRIMLHHDEDAAFAMLFGDDVEEESCIPIDVTSA